MGLKKGRRGLAVLGTLLTVFFIWSQRNSCAKLSCLNIDLSAYQIDQTYENSQSAYRILFKGEQEDTIRIVKKQVNKESQSSVISSEIQKINAYYENAISPYPGQISDEIECPKNFIPELKTRKIGGQETNYFEAYLTERLGIGACSNEQAKNKEIIAWYYCEDQENLYQIEIISEKERFNQNTKYFYSLLDSISCK